MKMKFENGELSFKIVELFQEMIDVLGEDEREEFLESLYLIDEAYIKFIHNMRETFAAPSYNSDYFKLFQSFIMAPSRWRWDTGDKDVIKRLSDTLIFTLERNLKLSMELNHLMSGKWKFLNRIEQAYPEHYNAIRGIYLSDHNIPYLEIGESARERVKELDVNKVVEEWLKTIKQLLAEGRQPFENGSEDE